VVAYVGEASGNAQYTTLDVLRLERVAMGLDGGFSAYRNVDPRLVADVNGDGTVNLADRDILSDEVQFLNGTGGADRAEIPPAGMGPIVFSGPDPLVAIPGDLKAVRGETLVVPVLLDTAQDLESVQLTLGYDVNALEVLAVRAGSLTSRFPYFLERHDGGTVYVDMSGPRLAGGAGSLIELEVRVRESATGPISIDFQAAALNEGHLTIGVLPQTGTDPTDGCITIAPSGSNPHEFSEMPGSGSSRVAGFFEGFSVKVAAFARRIIGQFLDPEAGIEPELPSPRLSEPKPVAAARAQTIDFNGRFASFTVTGNEATERQLQEGQRWKRELAGESGPATDPNSGLRVPVSAVTSRLTSK
jgi:hypothetical protein